MKRCLTLCLAASWFLLGLAAAQAPQLDPPRTHLLLQAHRSQEKTAEYLLVSLEAEAPRLGQPLTLAGLATSWQNHYRAPAAHAGGAGWVTAEPGAAGAQVVLRGADGAVRLRVAVGEVAPSALHQVRELVLVGQGKRVLAIDLRAEAPAPRTVCERPEMRGKAYDLFARRGDWLFAIDDVVVPIYADSFRIGADLSLTHEQGMQLPGVINGSYVRAALWSSGRDAGTLFALAPYGILDGWGHDLTALPIAGGKVTTDSGNVLQNAHGDPPVLEEHVPRGEAGPGNQLVLCAGEAYSPWTGLALQPQPEGALRILAAANERGLLVLPAVFDRTTQATVALAGETCRDVLVAQDAVWALVGGDQPALLRLDPATLAEQARTPLPTEYRRIVQ